MTMLLFDSIDPIDSVHWLRHFTRNNRLQRLSGGPVLLLLDLRMPEAGVGAGGCAIM